MILKNNFIRGTVILTFSGLLGRLIGFFYRVFLSRTIGAEGVGLYQLVFPVYVLACSITVSGIQSAISRQVSARRAVSDQKGALRVLFSGLFLSLCLCTPVSAFLIFFSHPVSVLYLKNQDAATLLRIMAFAIPFASFHACIDGYYYGIQKTSIPAARQLFEECIRFFLLLLLSFHLLPFYQEVSPAAAVFILVFQEIFAALFSSAALLHHLFVPHQIHRRPLHLSFRFSHLASNFPVLVSMALPLTGNRIFVSVLQSCEATFLPMALQFYGYSSAQALQLYGVLSGMALPMILFPTAITGSLSTMLLPSIAAAQSANQPKRIQTLIQKSGLSCFALGLFFSIFFLFFGRPVTSFLFQNEMAGYYVQAFAFTCPLLYLNPVLFSILNGLGKSSTVFFCSLSSMLLRLLFVWFAVPRLGITGYFIGLFCSQLFCALLCILAAFHKIPHFCNDISANPAHPYRK